MTREDVDNIENEMIINNYKFTLNNNLLIFNNARNISFNTFKNTLSDLYGKPNISEKDFKNEWLKRLKKEEHIIADGWYNPPPEGMAVLFGKRISFDSLRNKENWANDSIIDWENDLLYGYCSPVDKSSGIIGDMSITLYFGNDLNIKKHIIQCHNAVLEIFEKLNSSSNSNELFKLSEQVFEKYKLKNCIISKTDNMPLDLGHTFPKLENIKDQNRLTEDEKQIISKSRRFINENTSWDFTDGMEFTIEPQLISIENSELPQISQHYLVKKMKDKFIICNDIDELLIKYELI